MSRNPRVKQLLISKLETWTKFEEDNIIEVVSDELVIDQSVVEEIARDLIEQFKNKTKILANIRAGHGP